MLNKLEKILHEMGINYQRRGESLFCMFHREQGELLIILQIQDIGKEVYLLHAISPRLGLVAESAREEIIQEINRVNQGLTIGHLNLNQENGEIFFRWSIPFEDETASQALGLFVNLAINAVEHLAPVIPNWHGLIKSGPSSDETPVTNKFISN